MATQQGGSGRLQFLIVGTPRSGTTLVQRLLSELPGVLVPAETHFFTVLLPRMRELGATFPMTRGDLKPILEQHARLKVPSLNVEDTIDRLRGSAHSPWHLFQCLAESLAPGKETIGEKTPGHLRWWLPISRQLPWIKFVWVVRDPRAVVGSLGGVPWNRQSVSRRAYRWRADTACGLNMTEAMGSDRCMTLVYERLVEQPVQVLAELRTFLDLGAEATVDPGQTASVCAGPRAVLFEDSEWWKSMATQDPDPARATAWRRELSPQDVHLVDLVCGRVVEAAGYARGPMRLGERLQAAVRALGSVSQLGRGVIGGAMLRRQAAAFDRPQDRAARAVVDTPRNISVRRERDS